MNYEQIFRNAGVSIYVDPTKNDTFHYSDLRKIVDYMINDYERDLDFQQTFKATIHGK